MSESEAELRIKQTKQRALQIKELLENIQNVLHNKKDKKNFITPDDYEKQNIRWKNFVTSSSRQHYGITQNITTLKRQVNCDNLGIDTLRLFASVSLSLVTILKGLLKFPNEVSKALSSSADSVPVRMLSSAQQALQLVSHIGILCDNTQDNSIEESNTTTTSVVESEVVEELKEQNRVSQHIEALVAEKLLSQSQTDGDRSTSRRQGSHHNVPSIELPQGRVMHLLEDTLSHRLVMSSATSSASHPYLHKANSNVKNKTLHKARKSKFHTLKSPSDVLPPVKQVRGHKNNRFSHPRSSKFIDHDAASSAVKEKLLMKPKHKEHSDRNNISIPLKARSNKTGKLLRDYRKQSPRNVSTESDNSWSSDESEGDELWQQLMPLLMSQDVIFGDDSDEEAFSSTLARVEALIDRVTILQDQTKSLGVNIDEEGEAAPDKVDIALREAQELLSTMGFTTYDQQCGLTTPPPQSEETSDEQVLVEEDSSASLLGRSRAQREEFWAKLAASGYVQ